MFTGLIEECGRVARFDDRGDSARVVIEAATVLEGTKNGDSISVNGVCLTALDVGADSFAADVSAETLERSTLRSLAPGSRVNLERAVIAATRLGGHIVQGHVDGRGEFLSAAAVGDFWTVTIGFPSDLARYFVEKGSVAVEGISLTIAALHESSFDIALIPKTWEMTSLSSLKHGDRVNLEVDIIAKYVERMMHLKKYDRTPELDI
ncbi:MAG: riboflavin synthase [Blastocatellia bacterium]|nr:riboflavin synthase [Blastocatellia bacterium]